MIVPLRPDPAETTSDNAARLRSEAVDELGRRDRKKRATRQALRDAALLLVAERGFAHVTIEDIAEAADVSTRTFFNYFPTKESAVIGADPDRVARIAMNLLERPATETPLQALSAVLIANAAEIEEELDDLGEGRDAWFRRFSVVRSDPDLLGAYVAHVTSIEHSLVATLADRLGTDPTRDPYPALVVTCALGSVRVAAMHWSANGGLDSLALLTATALRALATGFVDRTLFLADTPTAHAGPHPSTKSPQLKEVVKAQ